MPAAFKLHAQLLAHVFNLVESNQVLAPLWSPATPQPPGMNNQTFLREYFATKFRAAFPQLTKCVARRAHNTRAGRPPRGSDTGTNGRCAGASRPTVRRSSRLS